MASALVSGASGPGLSPGRGHCVVFLGKTLAVGNQSVIVTVVDYNFLPVIRGVPTEEDEPAEKYE